MAGGAVDSLESYVERSKERLRKDSTVMVELGAEVAAERGLRLRVEHIWDWPTPTVWEAIAEFGWDWSRHYRLDLVRSE